jgi:hypothetical protein
VKLLVVSINVSALVHWEQYYMKELEHNHELTEYNAFESLNISSTINSPIRNESLSISISVY